MSQGAIFTLVQRDERYDKFLTLSDQLRARLDAIRVKRRAAGEKNAQPTFADLAATHILHTHATFRPYVAVASEYTQVSPAGGDGATAIGASGGSVQFSFPSFGHFTSDIALRVQFEAVGTETPVLAGAAGPFAPSLRYRYCSYPGMRLPRLVELRSNEVLIDDYTPDDAVMWNEFFMKDDYLTAFDRSMGQQQRKTADFYNSNGYTQTMVYQDGAQTPKFYQPPLEMFIPLQFWFCRDPAQALLNDMLPATQRKIVVTMAPLADILQAFDQAGAAQPLPFTRLRMHVSLYVNNLYINPEIYDIFASRVEFRLIRVHRRQRSRLQAAAGRVLQDQLKYPSEFIMLGVRDVQNANDFDNWLLFGRAPARTPATALIFPAAVWNAALSTNQLVIATGTESLTLEPVVATLGVTAQGVPLFAMAGTQFYGAYIPQRYFQLGTLVSTPDSSLWMVPFCLFPGLFAPSGYYNLSSGRELYVEYKSRAGEFAITPARPAEMVASMSALNFLVRKGDSFQLRYAL